MFTVINFIVFKLVRSQTFYCQFYLKKDNEKFFGLDFIIGGA